MSSPVTDVYGWPLYTLDMEPNGPAQMNGVTEAIEDTVKAHRDAVTAPHPFGVWNHGQYDTITSGVATSVGGNTLVMSRALDGAIAYTGTGTWTVSRPGLWRVEAQATWVANANGGRHCRLYVTEGGGVLNLRHINQQPGSAAGFVTCAISQTIYCVAGDQVQWSIWQNSGAALQVIGDANRNTCITFTWTGP